MKSKNKGKYRGWYGTFPNEGHDGTPPAPLRKLKRGEIIKSVPRARALRAAQGTQERIRKVGTGAGTSCPWNPRHFNKDS